VGDGKTEEYCHKENIPILQTIPLDTNIASFYSRGVPLVEGMPEYKKSFVELYEKIGETVNERSSNPQR
jgi:MinD superfamily P-loop ATPase